MNATQSNSAVSRTARIYRLALQTGMVLGICLLASSRSHAQFRGDAASYGSDMGMTLYDQELLKMQFTALNYGQIQLYDAQSAQAYWMAALAREQAVAISLATNEQLKRLRVQSAPAPARRSTRAVATTRRRAASTRNAASPPPIVVARTEP
jgi:hypothetical protein